MSAWKLFNVMNSVERLYQAQSAQGTARYPAAILSHARIRTDSAATFEALTDEIEQSSIVKFVTATGDVKQGIFWAQLDRPIQFVGNQPLEWLEVTQPRSGDQNIVDALVFRVPNFGPDEAEKVPLLAPWEQCVLRFQHKDAATIIDEWVHRMGH